jgi:predicted ATPase
VWFVDLSTIADAVALPGSMASALALGIVAGVDPLDQITTYLAPRDALLVVDNCEHLVDEVSGGHTHTPHVAAKALASLTAEFVARRPQVASDFLMGFAYLRHLR